MVRVHDRVDVPDPGTLIGLKEQPGVSEVRVTVPVNPVTGATVIVEVPGDPALTVTAVGLAERLKFETMAVMATV